MYISVNADVQNLVLLYIKNFDCSTTETAESGVEELSEKSNFFSPATASQSKEEETTRKSSLKTAFSSSFVDPFR